MILRGCDHNPVCCALSCRFSMGRWTSAASINWRTTWPSAPSHLPLTPRWPRSRRPPCGAPYCAQSRSTRRTAARVSSLLWGTTSTRSTRWKALLLSWTSWHRPTIRTTGGTVTITKSFKLWQRGKQTGATQRSSRGRKRRKKRGRGY